MPKFYCEYCDIYLTHSSPAGRRQHTTGRKHINAKVEYFQNLIRHPDFRPPEYIMQLGPAILEKGTSNPYIGMQQSNRDKDRGIWRGGRDNFGSTPYNQSSFGGRGDGGARGNMNNNFVNNRGSRGGGFGRGGDGCNNIIGGAMGGMPSTGMMAGGIPPQMRPPNGPPSNARPLFAGAVPRGGIFGAGMNGI